MNKTVGVQTLLPPAPGTLNAALDSLALLGRRARLKAAGKVCGRCRHLGVDRNPDDLGGVIGVCARVNASGSPDFIWYPPCPPDGGCERFSGHDDD